MNLRDFAGPKPVSRKTRAPAVLLFGLCSSVLACSGAADIPKTPDLTELQREFEKPTAVLDETSVGEAIQAMPPLKQLAAGFRAAAFTTQGVNTASGEADSDAGSRLKIQGSINVTLRCPGELDVPAYGNNGTVTMTLGVEKNLIKRGIAMNATDCVLRGYVLGVPVRVDVEGPVDLDLGGDLGLRSRWVGRLLMHVRGTLDVGGFVLTDVAARWNDDRLEYLFRLPNETWVIAVITNEGSVTVRDNQVTWGCSDGQACAAL